MPSKMDGSKPPDWIDGLPPNMDIPEVEILSDSDDSSEGLWPQQQEALTNLLALQTPGDTSIRGRRHNRQIQHQIHILRQGFNRDSELRSAEREHYALRERERREQQIRLRRYNTMQQEIISINGMLHQTQEDVNDLNDLYLSSDNLQAQINEYIRLHGFD